jgi:hypothetical protein
MRKILIICFVVFCSFSAGKMFSVQGSVEDWTNVLFVIDQSDAPAKQRNAARDMIVGQVNKQMQDTTIKK